MATNFEGERAALVAELKTAETELSTVRSEYDELMALYRDRGAHDVYSQRPPRCSELSEIISNLEPRVVSINERLEFFDKIQSYCASVAEAPALAKSSREAAQNAEKQLAELTAKIAKVRARIETFQTDSSNAKEQAAAQENSAAQSYAAAISSGDAKAEKTALAVLEKTRDEVAGLRRKIVSNSTIINALEAEFIALEESAAAMKTESDGHLFDMYMAIRAIMRAEWDAAAAKLSGIGTRLEALARRTDIPSGLYDLHIPIFRPDLSYVDGRGISRSSGEVSDEDLFECVRVPEQGKAEEVAR
jgi:chromosome segregation ATPase